jgi:thioredoxin-like negative regulator of GroEL
VVAAADDLLRVKIDADKNRQVVQKYGVKGFPTVLFLDASGRKVDEFVGAQDAATIKGKLAKLTKH